MKTFSVKEEHLVSIHHYPDESINANLLQYVDSIEWNNSYKTNLMAEMTSWCVNHSLVSKITEWIVSCLIESRPNLDPEIFSYHIHEVWFARYNIDDFAHKHSHGTHPFSFVYFVNTPEKSSPFSFFESQLSIPAEAGKAIIFPGNVKHFVVPNKCENRVVLAGNIIILNSDECIDKKH